MKKWTLYCALLLCLFALALPCYAADATPPPIPTTGDVWDGSIEQPTKIVKVNGVNYYEITKCSQLAFVAQTGGEWLARNYLLANDLILNDVVLEWDSNGYLQNNTRTLRKWTPIGNWETVFSGLFDGGDHTISGLYVEKAEDYAGLFGYSLGSIRNITVVNAYVKGNSFVAGIAGDCKETVERSTMGRAFIKGNCYVGGIVGHSHHTTKCVSFCTVNGEYNVGGICGTGSWVDYCKNYGGVIGVTNVGGIDNYEYYNGTNGIRYCINYGTVSGVNRVGGIEGYGGGSDCANYGAIVGSGENIGGIVGEGFFRESTNHGAITGKKSVGGIAGSSFSVVNSCNHAIVTGESNVGGVVGVLVRSSLDKGEANNCYNLADIVCTVADGNVGAIVGSDGAVWNHDTIIGCYYPASANLYGCGGVISADMEPDGFFAKSSAELKQQATFEGWDFYKTWRVSPKYNDGYPYLAWEHADDAPPLEGLALDRASLALSVGDEGYLTVSPVPADAEVVSLTWKSSNNRIATVNSNGRVTAVAAGTATVTVSGGGFSASCTVTVSPRAGSEYRIGALTVRDNDGAALDAIPQGAFLVTVPVTRTADGGNALVVLAAYSESGQYQGLLYLNLSGVPTGATVEFTLPVDNANGNIARLKAFPIASFANPVPLGAASVFPAQ